MSSLPESSAIKIRQQQERLQARLSEVQEMNRIRENFQRTKLDAPPLLESNQTEAKISNIKLEDVKPFAGVSLSSESKVETTSNHHMNSRPLTIKRRLALRSQLSSSPPSSALCGSISLAESLQLQEQAAARERKATELRIAQMQRKERSRMPKKIGKSLQGALLGQGGGQGAVFAQFMSHADSDGEEEEEGVPNLHEDDEEEEEEEEDPLIDAQEEMLRIQQGQLDEEEDRELNPYTHAYYLGRSRAIEEEKTMAKGGGELGVIGGVSDMEI